MLQTKASLYLKGDRRRSGEGEMGASEFTPPARAKRSAVTRIGIGAAMLLSACNPAQDDDLRRNATDEVMSKRTAPSFSPAPKPTGLCQDEVLNIQHAISGRFLSARYKSRYDMLYADADCAGVFTVEQPVIFDVMLGEGTGKLRVVVPFTLHTIPPRRRTVPTDQCYGFIVPQMNFGQPVRIPFEFRVEKWQTG